jgi:hypothetical protein
MIVDKDGDEWLWVGTIQDELMLANAKLVPNNILYLFLRLNPHGTLINDHHCPVGQHAPPLLHVFGCVGHLERYLRPEVRIGWVIDCTPSWFDMSLSELSPPLKGL